LVIFEKQRKEYELEIKRLNQNKSERKDEEIKRLNQNKSERKDEEIKNKHKYNYEDDLNYFNENVRIKREKNEKQWTQQPK